MSKICPKCNHEWPDDFMACPLDGTPLLPKEQQSAGFNLNLGDANAISGGIHMSDNHTVTNTTTNYVDSHNVTTNNITQIIKERSSEEIEAEKAKAKAEAAKAEADAEKAKAEALRVQAEVEAMTARCEAEQRERERRELEIAEQQESERKEKERQEKAREEQRDRERREKERDEKEWQIAMKQNIEADYEYASSSPFYGFETERLDLPNTISKIGKHAFDTSMIDTISIPNTVKKIGPYAFANSALRFIAISDSVCEIGTGAFDNCYFLEKIIVPSGSKQYFDKMEGLAEFQGIIIESA